MLEAALALVSLALGLAAGLLYERRKSRTAETAHHEQVAGMQAELHQREVAIERERIQRETEEKAHERALAEQRKLLEESQKKLEDAFGNLSKAALRDNNQMFLQQADEKLKPLKETLTKLEKSAQEMESKRAHAYGSLETHLTKLAEQTEGLKQTSGSLATALRGSSQARGKWGEMALRNIVELAGMTKHCDFTEQTATADRNIPDMIVRLPGGGRIPIDAKAPFPAYHEATRTDDPAERKRHLKQHAADLRTRVRELAKRDYSKALDSPIDFTVLFLPAEPLLSAAFEELPELQDEALRARVLIATPTTLVALLRTVGLYWEQQAVADNAKHVWEEARELYSRVVKFEEHLLKVGKGIEAATKAYDSAESSFRRRVMPSGRRLEELEVPQRGQKTLQSEVEHEPHQRELEAGAE